MESVLLYWIEKNPRLSAVSSANRKICYLLFIQFTSINLNLRINHNNIVRRYTYILKTLKLLFTLDNYANKLIVKIC